MGRVGLSWFGLGKGGGMRLDLASSPRPFREQFLLELLPFGAIACVGALRLRCNLLTSEVLEILWLPSFEHRVAVLQERPIL